MILEVQYSVERDLSASSIRRRTGLVWLEGMVADTVPPQRILTAQVPLSLVQRQVGIGRVYNERGRDRRPETPSRLAQTLYVFCHVQGDNMLYTMVILQSTSLLTLFDDGGSKKVVATRDRSANAR